MRSSIFIAIIYLLIFYLFNLYIVSFETYANNSTQITHNIKFFSENNIKGKNINYNKNYFTALNIVLLTSPLRDMSNLTSNNLALATTSAHINANINVTSTQVDIASVSKIFKGSLIFPVLPQPKADTPIDIIRLEVSTGTNSQVINNYSQRPLAIMVENHAHARPQTALNEAQVVYEIPVEGGITRFMALYYHIPDVVGPVRSCREYFIDRAFEVNPLYVHCGGSPKGYEYIGKTNIFAIDEIRFGAPFFRDKSRKAPHNLYVRGQKLVEFASKMHPMQLPYKRLPLLFSNNPTIGTEPAVGLHIRYHGNYFVTYKYNPKYKCYDRYMNSIQHLDRVTQKPISPKTIILQEAVMKVIDDKGRQEISFYGEGNAYIFYLGTLIRAKWKKTALRDFTRYYTLDGKQVEFSNEGPVWIQVISPAQPWITVPNNINNDRKLALVTK